MIAKTAHKYPHMGAKIFGHGKQPDDAVRQIWNSRPRISISKLFVVRDSN
ncbi:MAG: hypothetical protein NTV08_01740 [Verrucomicrobia bacterium]|nr:hypothetical protein [Verrucomicrobiota bacterium]